MKEIKESHLFKITENEDFIAYRAEFVPGMEGVYFNGLWRQYKESGSEEIVADLGVFTSESINEENFLEVPWRDFYIIKNEQK